MPTGLIRLRARDRSPPLRLSKSLAGLAVLVNAPVLQAGKAGSIPAPRTDDDDEMRSWRNGRRPGSRYQWEKSRASSILADRTAPR